MRSKIILACLLVLVVAAVAGAQTKISGTGGCAKPDPQYAIAIGDRPNHSFLISQSKCTWSKPWEIKGVAAKEGVAVDFYEVRGSTARFRGYYVDTMANGDEAIYPYQGTATLKDGTMESAEWKWTIVRPTGKLRGIKGEGTCKGKGNPDGSVTFECEGEYQLPK